MVNFCTRCRTTVPPNICGCENVGNRCPLFFRLIPTPNFEWKLAWPCKVCQGQSRSSQLPAFRVRSLLATADIPHPGHESQVLATNRHPIAQNRLLLYPQKPTVSWPSPASGCDPFRKSKGLDSYPGKNVDEAI